MMTGRSIFWRSVSRRLSRMTSSSVSIMPFLARTACSSVASRRTFSIRVTMLTPSIIVARVTVSRAASDERICWYCSITVDRSSCLSSSGSSCRI